MNWTKGDDHYIESDTGHRVSRTKHAEQYLYTAWGKRGEIVGIYEKAGDAKKACCTQASKTGR